MPLPINHGGNLRRQFLNKQLMSTGANSAGGLTEEQIARAKKWISRYRRNWDLFVEEILQIKLYPIQKIMIHMLGVSDQFFAIATRGAAKSFLVALGAICEFCLKPYSEIVITSSTIPQASKLVEKKIRDEIIKKLSPYLLYMYQHEYITIVMSSEGSGYVVENKLNGSTITVTVCSEASRGIRSTWNIYEEARLLKKNIIDSVFEPMGHCRPAKYLTFKKYQTRRWLEKAKSTYITSARYKFEWFYNTFKTTVAGYYNSKHELYVPFAEDIFAAIDDGSRTWADYRKNKKAMSEMDFEMEILNIMQGEVENSYFTIQQFKENQTLERAWKAPSNFDVITGAKIGNKLKAEDEVRLVCADYAFANTVRGAGRRANDNTIIICMSLHWKGDHFERHVDYIQGWEASDSTGAEIRVRELYWDYQADYIVDDQQSGGEVLYNLFTQQWEHPERGHAWNSHGLTISDKLEYVSAVAIDSKIEDYKSRTADPHAVPCIIPVKGSSTLNSTAWVELRRQIDYGNIKFLIDSQSFQEELADSGEYFKMTSEQYGVACAPYNHTEELIKEAVNLKAEFKQDKVRLSEPLNGTKDRIVALAYGNYIATLIENRWNKDIAQDEFDIDSIQLVW